MARTDIGGWFIFGLASARPAASAVLKDTRYFATDTGVVSGSDGVSTWTTLVTYGIGVTPTISYSSNAMHVAEISFAGSSNAVARSDHMHAGIAQATSSSSNALQRGTLNLRAGTNMGLTATDTDGDGEFDTITFHSTGSGGGGSSSLTVEEVDGSPTDSAVTKLVFPNGTLGIASHVATYTPSGGGSYTAATAPAIVQGVGTSNSNTTNPTLTIASAASGHTLILGVNLVGRASTSVTCTNVTWTKVAGPTTSSGGSRYETWVGVVAGGASGTTITVNTGSSNFASLVVAEIADTITVSAGTPYDSDFTGASFGPLVTPTAGKLVVMMAGYDNTTNALQLHTAVPMTGFSRQSGGTGTAIMCGYSNGDSVTGSTSPANPGVGHAQIVTVT